MVAHEPAESGTNEELALEPPGDPPLEADRALVTKEGAPVKVQNHETVLQQVEWALHALESDFLGFPERDPFHGAIDLLSARVSAPEGGEGRMELDEPAVALGLQHQRRAAIGPSRAERGEHLERPPATGVDVELYRLEGEPHEHPPACPSRAPPVNAGGETA